MEVRNPWTVLSKEVKYENPWMRVEENKVLNPAGKDGIYGVVHIKDYAVAILPLDKNYNTWIVGQYRFPFDTFEWEIIEGAVRLEHHRWKRLEESYMKKLDLLPNISTLF